MIPGEIPALIPSGTLGDMSFVTPGATFGETLDAIPQEFVKQFKDELLERFLEQPRVIPGGTPVKIL